MADSPRFALMIDSRESAVSAALYLHVAARVVTLADDDSPRNISAPYGTTPESAYFGIGASAQADRDPSRANDGAEYSYGWRFGMTGDEFVRSDTLAAVLATLRKAERRIEASRERYGSPRTFGAYVARIADALGLPVLFGRSGADGFYSSGDWQTVASGDAADRIDSIIRRFRSA